LGRSTFQFGQQKSSINAEAEKKKMKMQQRKKKKMKMQQQKSFLWANWEGSTFLLLLILFFVVKILITSVEKAVCISVAIIMSFAAPIDAIEGSSRSEKTAIASVSVGEK
jgi:hypothetical protein